MSKKKFEDVINSFTNDFYREEDYLQLFRENSFLINLLNSLNKVTYIPYIYFNLNTNNLKIQKDCISILMNNEKNLKNFILNSIETESEFYCINISFWNEWCIYCDWDFGLNSNNDKENKNNNIEKKNNKENILNNNFSNNLHQIKKFSNEFSHNNLNNNNHSNDIILEIHTDYICGIIENSLRPSIEYFIDYVLLTPKIYNLFKLWYRKYGEDIIVRTISYSFLDFKNSFQIDIENESFLLEDKNFIKNWPLVKCNPNKKILNLIEVYPLNFRFFKYDEIISSIKVNVINLDSVKDILEKVINNPNSNVRRTLFVSRKTNFISIKNRIYDFGNLPSGSKQNSRIWIYNNGDLKIIENENYLLEKYNISDKFIIVIEIKINNQWPSNSLIFFDKEKNIENNLNYNNLSNFTGSNTCNKNTKFFYGKGIVNIGNTCYMNSVLQILLNLENIKNFLTNINFAYWKNRKNKYGYNGRIIDEFAILFDEYQNHSKEVIKPLKFKFAIGEINPQFKNLDQQDSQEFLSYLIDVLHEELNIKSDKEYIVNPENYDGCEEQLSGEYWANNLRRNTSFIHSLFLGQMKSTLTCGKCQVKKISYETFTNLNIPIPQKKTILLNIIMHRIPFTYKAYYFENYGEKIKLLNQIDNKIKDLNNLEKIKKSYNEEDKEFISNMDEGFNHKINKLNQEKIYEEEKQKDQYEEIFNLKSYLNIENKKNREEKSKNDKENKYYIEIDNEILEKENNNEDNYEIYLENISRFSVRERLNFLRKESYEKIKLVSKNFGGEENEQNTKLINTKKNELDICNKRKSFFLIF